MVGSPAALAQEQHPLWAPWAELGGQAGDEAAAFLEGFVPIGQDEETLVFLDLRLSVSERSEGTTSFGIGARKIVGENLALGGNAFIDAIRTDNNNVFAALNFGVEAFTSNFDFSVNAHVPLGGGEALLSTVSSSGPQLVGNSLQEGFTTNERKEAPLYGIAAELGALLDSPLGDNQKLRAFVGGYHYDRDGYDNQTGGRFGLEYRIDDPFGFDGARFTLGAEAVYDQDDDFNAVATARLRIPLFSGQAKAPDGSVKLSGLQQQLDERVHRDALVRAGEQSTAGTTTFVTAINPLTNQAFGQFFFADGLDAGSDDGSFGNPFALATAVTQAGANGVIVAVGENGPILTSGVTLQQGQTLIGGGQTIAVRLANGSVVNYQLDGTRGTIDGDNGATTITLANNVTIRDLVIQGGDIAIGGNGVSNVTLRNLEVQNTTGDGVNITGATNATIDTIAFSGIGGTNLFLNNNAATISNITINGGTDGIRIDNNTGTTTLSNISISNVSGDGLGFANNGGTIGATGVMLNTIGGDGIVINGGGTFAFAGTTTIAGLGVGAASDGIDLTGTSGASLTFGDIDITGLGGGTGLNLAGGDAAFNATTLDITGASTAGSRGVDLSGTLNGRTVNIANGGNIAGVDTGVVLGANGAAGVTANADFTWGGGTISGGIFSLDGVGVVDTAGSYDFGTTIFTDAFNFLNSLGDYFVSQNGSGLANGTSVANAAPIGDAIMNAAGLGATTFVLINNGSDITTSQTFALVDGQTLASFGNGATFTTGGQIVANNISGDNVPDGSAEVVDDPTGNGAATLVNTAGDTVAVANGNTISNLNLGNAAVGSYAISGTGVTNLTLAGIGIGLGATNSVGGIELANVTGMVQAMDIDIEGGNALSVSGGNATISFDSASSIANDDGFAVSISGRIGGSFSHFGNISSDGATAGGIAVSGAMAASNVTFGGSVSLGTNTSLSGGAGVEIDNNGQASAVAFNGGIDVATSGQTGFAATGGGSLTLASGSVTTASGSALDLSGVSADVSLTNVTSTNSGGIGVSLSNLTGAGVTVSGVTTVSDASGSGIQVGGNAAAISFGQTTVTNPVGDGIQLTGNSGTVNFGTTNVTLGVGVNIAGVDIGGVNDGQITFGDTTITGVATGQTGIDFTGAEAPATFGVTAISGADGTGIDLSSTQNNVEIAFATGSSINLTGASAVGVELASDNTSNTAANANFRFGDGSGVDANMTNSSINVASGITVDTVGVQMAQGTYNFEDVAFTGSAAFVTVGLQFVHASAGTGDGSLLNPFTVAQALAATDTDQTFVFLDGNYDFGSTTFALDDGQNVVGLDNNRMVMTSGPAMNITGLGASGGQVISRVGGQSISISNSSGADVFSFLGSSMIADLTIDGTGGGNAFSAGATNGSITVDGVTVQNVASGQAAFSFNGFNGSATVQNSSIGSAGGGIASVTSGNGSYAFNGVTTTGTGATGNTGILLDSLGAGSSFNYTSALTLSGFGTGIDINNVGGTITFGNTTTINDAAIAGIEISNSTGNVSFGGRTTITNTVAAGHGIDLGLNAGGANTGTYTFNGLDVTVNGANAYGLRAQTSGTVNVLDPGGNNQITSSNGTVVFINPTLVNIALTNVTSQNATGSGLDLNLVSGSTFTVTGTASVTGSDVAGVEITNSGGSTISFGTLNIDNDDAMAEGMGLVVNNSATGTVNVTVSGGIIASGNHRAISVANTGSGGIALNQTYSSISVDGADRGVSIGVAGGGTVTGTLNTGTGGAIQNTTEAAVVALGGMADIAIGQFVSVTAGDVAFIDGLAAGGSVELGGNINATGGSGIFVNNSAGDVTFSGTSKVLNVGVGTGVTISNSASGSVSFINGGLDIDTTMGTGFSSIVGGNLTITGNGNSITSGTGTALQLNSTTIGDGGFNLASLNASGAVQGAVIDGLSQTLSSTGVNIAGGTISSATSRGVDINNASANISIGTAITATGSARSVEVTNSGATGGNSITFSGLVTDTGVGINLDKNNQNGGNATVTFSGGLNLSTGANTALSATNGGIVDIAGASSTIQTTTATAINANGGTFTISGSNVGITTTSGAGIDATAATLNIGGSDVTVTTDSGTGIDVDGGVLNISGTNVGITSTSGTGINATGGGTVNATGASTDVTTGTGTGVNIDGTTIGASGFALRSVSVNGAINGIRLNNTGNTGGIFAVTGDGTKALNSSGGTIQNTTGDGVELTDAYNVTLQSLNIFNVGDGTTDGTNGGNTLSTSDHAIQSEDSGDIILSGVHIQAPQGSGWEAVNLTGVNRIDSGSVFEGINTSNYQALEVRNSDADPASFTISGSTFKDQASTNGSSYVLFQSFGASNLDITIENGSVFENLFGYAVQSIAGADTGGSGTVTTTIRGSTFQNAVAGTEGVGASGGIGGISISARENATANFDIDTNIFNDIGRPLANSGVISIQGIGGTGKTIDGIIHGNNIDRIGYVDSMSSSNTGGYRVIEVVTENDIAKLDVEITGNFIDDTGKQAIYVSARGASQDFDVLINNNKLGVDTPIGQTNEKAIEILTVNSSKARIAIIDNEIEGNIDNGLIGMLSGVVDVDVEDTSSLDLIFTDNIVSNANVGTNYIVIDTEGGTLCLSFERNTAPSAEFGVSGTFQVEDYGNIAANNLNVVSFIDGVGVTASGGACQAPTF